MHKTILAAAAALLAGVGLAAAQQEAPAMHEGQLDQLDANDNGGVSQEEYQVFMTRAFDAVDGNGDGILVESEVVEVLTPEQLAAIDADGDGRASRSEFMERVMTDFATADGDGDGHLK